jgi:pyruvate-formate lyase-activating enzyme
MKRIVAPALLRPVFAALSGGYGTVARVIYPLGALPPLRIEVIFTSRCNLRCPFCLFREHLNQPERSRLTVGEWQAIAARMPRFTVISFGGGEPFLEPDIWPVLEALLPRCCCVTAVTNGTALAEEEMAFLVDRRLGYLMVSLDGMSEYHDRVRGGAGTFAKAVRALQALREIQRRQGRTLPRVGIKTNLLADNGGEIPRLLEFIEREIQADDICFNFPIETPLQKGFDLAADLSDVRFGQGNPPAYPPEAVPRVQNTVRWLLRARRRAKLRIGFVPRLDGERDLLDYVAHPEWFGVRTCTRPWTEYLLYPDGRISPQAGYYIDNIRHLAYDVRRVLGHPRYREFLRAYSRLMPFAPPCEGCCLGRPVRRRLGRGLTARRPAGEGEASA